MKEFSYSAKLAGDHYAGSVNAMTEDEARRQLERMSYTDIMLNDVAVSKRQIEQAVAKPSKMLDSTKPVNMIESYASDLNSFVNAFPSDIQSKQPATKTRKETVLVGEKTVLIQVNDLLLSKNGIVQKTLMHPDHQGKMHYLFVVEHDV